MRLEKQANVKQNPQHRRSIAAAAATGAGGALADG
jgi:hypothetical protein